MSAVSPAAAPLAAALPPLGAIGVETLISIAVLLMGVIGWVVQMAQQGKAQQARRPPLQPGNRPAQNAGGGNAGGADEKLRGEIDSFLQEVAGRRAGQRDGPRGEPNRPDAPRPRRGPEDPFEEPPRRRPKPATPSADVPDFLRPAARRTPEPDRRPPRPAPPPTPAPPPPKKRQKIRDRQLGRLAKKNLGGELREHVQKYMAVDQDELAREHVLVKSRLSAAERELSDLKRRLADPNDSARLAPPGGAARVGAGLNDPDRLRALLADPAGVRDAIVVNELIAKPLGLRGRSPAGRSARAAGTGGAVDPAALGSAALGSSSAGAS